jgi:hypothetical protein
VVAQVLGTNEQIEPGAGGNRPPHGDPVGHVHDPDRREREVRRGHQRHRQGKREDVRIGGRQRVAEPESTDTVV